MSQRIATNESDKYVVVLPTYGSPYIHGVITKKMKDEDELKLLITAVGGKIQTAVRKDVVIHPMFYEDSSTDPKHKRWDMGRQLLTSGWTKVWVNDDGINDCCPNMAVLHSISPDKGVPYFGDVALVVSKKVFSVICPDPTKMTWGPESEYDDDEEDEYAVEAELVEQKVEEAFQEAVAAGEAVITDDTIVSNIVCNQCEDTLPPMTVKDHLESNFTHECVPEKKPTTMEEMEVDMKKHMMMMGVVTHYTCRAECFPDAVHAFGVLFNKTNLGKVKVIAPVLTGSMLGDVDIQFYSDAPLDVLKKLFSKAADCHRIAQTLKALGK